MEMRQRLADEIKLVSWPSPQDYNEAVQLPSDCFNDADLKSGQAEIDKFGLPRPTTGNFASVYKVHCPQKDWAVRCFLHKVEEQNQHYQIVERELNKLQSQFTVEFT